MLVSVQRIDMAEPLRTRFAHFLVGGTLVVIAWAMTDQPGAGAAQGEPFTYKGKNYVMDPFTTLFSSATRVGTVRMQLFGAYLAATAEGMKRVTLTGSADPSKVWGKMTVEDRTTFLSITTALGALEVSKGVDLLTWLTSLEEIHGLAPPDSTSEYDNDKAYRLYVRMTSAGVQHVLDASGEFSNLCDKGTLDYGGLGSRHTDFCLLPNKFEDEGKTSNSPNLQFNVTAKNRCADIDLDFDNGILHGTKDNSNILGHQGVPFHANHLQSFMVDYCDPGFRPQ